MKKSTLPFGVYERNLNLVKKYVILKRNGNQNFKDVHHMPQF